MTVVTSTIMRDFLLSYDDVCLRPKYSELNSRSDADTSVEFLGKRWKLPAIPANMEDVIGFDNAKFLSENDYFYIMHRFKANTPKFIKWANENNLKYISVSVGIRELDNELLINRCGESNYRIDCITIDIAHGHHKDIDDCIEIIKCSYPNTKIIAGNVATSDGYKYICDCGVDAVKCGIGGGRICSTKFKTGFHIPTFQSVLDCSTWGIDIPIIADGGIKHNGDIAKALVAGASMVMCGGLFASCIDSPAEIVNGKKLYRGSTSYEAKGERKHIEGITLELDEGFTYEERLKEIKEDISSAISYSGGKDISAFNSVEWSVIR